MLRPAIVLGLVFTLAQATPPRQTFFQSPYPIDQIRNKQAVVETTMGAFVIELLPDKAPNHVGHFIKAAKDGAYVGTIFHRIVRYGIIQGGDPLSRDPAKSALYGSGGMNELRAESSGTEPYTAGAVAAVLLPGKPDSAGSQFFVCVTDQPTITGGYTIFGRVVDGMEVVQQISAVDADANGRPASRIEIKSVTIRDPPPVPFAADTAAELGSYRAVLQTTKGEIELQMLADLAPETVRNFLRWSTAGVYDGVKIHRVVPDFVIQMGSLGFRTTPISVSQQKLVHNLPPEFSHTPNLPGVVSIARGEDPGSGSTSFFICTGECRALEATYTVFARVVRGMEVVKAIEAGPVDGETPKEPVVVTTIKVEKKTAVVPRRPSLQAR
jgi:peptidyl-prolyl cis-trans isomerase B (cyclophilin B)